MVLMTAAVLNYEISSLIQQLDFLGLVAHHQQNADVIKQSRTAGHERHKQDLPKQLIYLG